LTRPTVICGFSTEKREELRLTHAYRRYRPDGCARSAGEWALANAQPDAICCAPREPKNAWYPSRMSEKSARELDQQLAHELTIERGHTITTIFLVAEIVRRETFVELGYSSIWDYLRRVHKQSDTMIHYRTRCAEAIRRFPQVVEPLRSGRLCMTTLAKLTEIMNESSCDALLAEALGKSKRDVERMIAREQPREVPKDVTRPIASTATFPGKSLCETARSAPPIDRQSFVRASEQHVETEPLTASVSRKHMNVDHEYEALLRELRAELSHKMPGAADFEILKECMRVTLKQLKKKKGIVDKPRATKVGKNGKISNSVKRLVEQRDQGKCQWRSEDGGICGSTHRVQFHHIQDRGRGGEGTPENIIQLCQKHNLLAAEIAWGEERIERFRERPRDRAPQDRSRGSNSVVRNEARLQVRGRKRAERPCSR
jgi:hypothetical protein